jgi:hypothetical protein
LIWFDLMIHCEWIQIAWIKFDRFDSFLDFWIVTKHSFLCPIIFLSCLRGKRSSELEITWDSLLHGVGFIGRNGLAVGVPGRDCVSREDRCAENSNDCEMRAHSQCQRGTVARLSMAAAGTEKVRLSFYKSSEWLLTSTSEIVWMCAPLLLHWAEFAIVRSHNTTIQLIWGMGNRVKVALRIMPFLNEQSFNDQFAQARPHNGRRAARMHSPLLRCRKMWFPIRIPDGNAFPEWLQLRAINRESNCPSVDFEPSLRELGLSTGHDLLRRSGLVESMDQENELTIIMVNFGKLIYLTHSWPALSTLH